MSEFPDPVAEEIKLLRAAVERVRNFDANTLIRKDDLGLMAFNDAVQPAQKLVDLFVKLPIDSLSEFPERQRQAIQSIAQEVSARFDDLLNFSISTSDPSSQRTLLVDRLIAQYQSAFSELFPYISYGIARTVDFAAIESRLKSTIDSVGRQTDEVMEKLRKSEVIANEVVSKARDAAAEQGVAQQAQYFGKEVTLHEKAAKRWLVVSVLMAISVLFYAFLSFYLTRDLKLDSPFESAQLIISKIIAFIVLSFGLFQSVRSYSAHMHNAVTNKHRQNALLTYTTLVEAGNTTELRDVVLQHAAAAIYAPNDSGYLKGEERGYGAQSLIALATRASSSNGTTGPA